MKREWAEYLFPLRFIPSMSHMTSLDRKTLYKGGTVVRTPPLGYVLRLHAGLPRR
ncbi:MAG: hypothetical protein OWQ51_13100 [Pyrobaculum arsenaticum]|uniref:Uncharacterized protein n=1 Tax=Pyrobaculum arsenaticum TaxID=121277 RepID=A0A7L4PAU4_9CREN|nr:hypothetical protein [Pyrobaculum arsenaticum]MCY0891878.1 hypothetical protein [Pyrobaculum arsenaticum]NYR15260.1 hypothetical protein [Pyrobaculum arsenaticum]